MKSVSVPLILLFGYCKATAQRLSKYPSSQNGCCSYICTCSTYLLPQLTTNHDQDALPWRIVERGVKGILSLNDIQVWLDMFCLSAGVLCFTWWRDHMGCPQYPMSHGSVCCVLSFSWRFVFYLAAWSYGMSTVPYESWFWDTPSYWYNFPFHVSKAKKKKKSCLVVLHQPPLIFKNWKKVFTVQKYTAPNFQNSRKSFFFSLTILIF